MRVILPHLYLFSLFCGFISQNRFANIYATDQLNDAAITENAYYDQNKDSDIKNSLVIGILDQSVLISETQQIKFINQFESIELSRIEKEKSKIESEFREYLNEAQQKLELNNLEQQKKIQENLNRRNAIVIQQQNTLEQEKLKVKTKSIKAANDLIQVWVKKAIEKNKLDVNCVLLHGVGFGDQVGSVIDYNTNNNKLIDITNYVIEVSIEDWASGVEIAGLEYDIKQN